MLSLINQAKMLKLIENMKFFDLWIIILIDH
jgi:hypothetical protein